MAKEAVLRVEKVAKQFGEKQVLRDITFDVKQGEIVGFIGRNGSGKTTTIKIILGLLKKTAGDVTICGKRVQFGTINTGGNVGYLPDVPEFYNYLRAEEYLRLNASIAGVPKGEVNKRVGELLQLVGLESRKKIGTFSRGMKQRLGVAQALIGRPKLLICDEPTSALDPMGRYDLLDTLQRIKHETTVVFSTHVLSDIERITDSIVMIDDGVVTYAGSVNALKKRHTVDSVRVECATKADLATVRGVLSDAVQHEDGKSIIVHCSDIATDYPKLIRKIGQAGVIPIKIELIEPDLEQLFMEMAE